MKKLNYFYKIILQILFISTIFTAVYGKNLADPYRSDRVSNYFLGIISLNDNDYGNSYNYFKKLDGLEDSHSAYSETYLHSLINVNRFNEAFKYSKNLEKKKISSYKSDLIIGIYHLKNQNYDLAKKYFKKNYKKKTLNPLELILIQSLINWSDLETKNFTQAQNKMNLIDSRFNNIKNIQNAFLHCYYENENTINYFKILTNNSQIDFSRYNFFLANYLNFKNKKLEAIELINKNLITSPRSLILNQLKLDLVNNKKDDFKNNFNCKNSSHIVAELFYLIANAFSSKFLFSESNFYLNLAKFLNPNFISYSVLQADNYYMTDNFKEASKMFKKIKYNGEAYDWHAAKKLSSILIREKKNEEAIANLTKNFQKIINPSVYHLYDYADFLRNNEKYKESSKYYSIILESISKSHKLYPSVTDGRGIAYERIGNWKKAEKDFLSSLSSNPNQPYVINYLAYTWIEQGVKKEESLKMLKKANKLRQNDGYITDSLGWALYKLDKFQEAKKYLQQAVTLMPSDPVINDHYGDSLWKNGDKLQARYYWNYVLNLENTEEELKKIIKYKLIFGPKLKT